MDKVEALKAIRTLAHVASDSDDIIMIHRLLREIGNVVTKALTEPPVRERA